MADSKRTSSRRTMVLVTFGTICIVVLGAVVVALMLRGKAAHNTDAARLNHDAVLADLITLATRAQQYYRIPSNLGGGGGSFAGLNDIRRLTKYPTNANGSYEVLGSRPEAIILQGTGVERNVRDSLVRVNIRVKPDSLSIMSDNLTDAAESNAVLSSRKALAENQKSLDDAFFRNHALVLQDLIHLGERAQQYFRRPAVLGGGGGTFKGLNDIAKLTLNPNNANGSFELLSANDTSVVLQGSGVEKDPGGSLNRLRVEVTASRILVIADPFSPAPTQVEKTTGQGVELVENSIRSNHDAVLNQLLILGARAQQYYRRPMSLGGGQSSFRDLNMQKLQGGLIPRQGTFSIVNVTDSSIVLEGIGTEHKPGGELVRIQMLVRASGDSVISDTLLK